MFTHVKPLDEVIFFCEAVGEREIQIAASQHVRVDRLRPDQLNWGEGQIDSTRFVYLQRRDLCDDFTITHPLVLNVDLERLL